MYKMALIVLSYHTIRFYFFSIDSYHCFNIFQHNQKMKLAELELYIYFANLEKLCNNITVRYQNLDYNF